MQKLLLPVIFFFPFYSFSQEINKLESRAWEFYNNEEYRMAAILYDSLLFFHPDSISFLQSSGNSYLNSGDASVALSRFKSAQRQEPGNPDHTFSIASAFDILNQKDSAIHHFKQYLLSRPGDSHALNRLAILYLDMDGYQDSALTYSNKAIENNPANPDSYYVNAMAYINADRPVEAMISATTGLERDSTYSLLYMPLGLSFYYREDFKEANRYFEKGMQYASEKSSFINFAVQSRLLEKTDKEMMEVLSGSEILFKKYRSDNLPALLKETKSKESPYFYPELLKKFSSDPLEFGLDDFIMLYLGFTNDKNYSPYKNEPSALNILLEEENYALYLEEARKYLILNPADFPLYLNLAKVSELYGMNDTYFKYLYCYYGFLRAVMATGSGYSMEEAIIITYLSHKNTLVSEYDYLVKSRSLSEEKKQVYEVLTLVSDNDLEKKLYFNVTIPNSWLKKSGLK